MVEARQMTYISYTNDDHSRSYMDSNFISDGPADGHFYKGLEHEMMMEDRNKHSKDLYVMMKNQNTEVDVSALQTLLQTAANLLLKPVGRRYGSDCNSASNITKTYVLHQCLADVP